MHPFYFVCAIFGTVFIFIQFIPAIFAGIGGDSGFDAGASSGGFDDASLSDTSNGAAAGGDSSDAAHHYGSAVGLLKMLSTRTVSAGLGFFGLAGLAAESADLSPALSFGAAALAGIAAFILVYFLYRLISTFRSNGATTEASLPGCTGMVHVRVPPNRAGSGKVLVTQQERSMEYEALTDAAETLPSGTAIIVREVLSTTQILVAPIESKKND